MDGKVELDDNAASPVPTTFNCVECGKIFLQKRYLTAHISRCPGRKVIEKKTHRCTLCGKLFSRLSHLRRHEAHHLRQQSFTCTVCDRAFVQRHHLERHYLSRAHIMKLFVKQSPNLIANSSIAVRDNTQASLSSSRTASVPRRAAACRRHKCYFCAKAFPTLWEMQRHWRTVHPYAVRKTTPSDSPTQHSAAKTTFLLKCTHCNLRFDNDLFYRNHMEWHQGRRPHRCDHCGVAFIRRLEMEAHTAAKHGIGWMFECAHCGTRFAQRTEIDRHLKKICSSSLARGENDVLADDDVNETEKSLSESSALRCKYCGANADGVSSYRKHIAVHHFRKVYVESPVSNIPSSSDSDSTALDQNSDGIASSVQIIVNVEPSSKPVHELKLGSKLPEWLLTLQPSYALLDVALDEVGEPLGPGESIVLHLPLPGALPPGINSRSIRISYVC